MNQEFYIRRRRISGINIIPLVDVMTVLIFFFLLSMKIDEVKHLGIEPPSASASSKIKSPAKIIIAVNAKGEYFVNALPVPQEELELAVLSASQREQDKSIILVSDGNSMTKHTVFVLDIAKKLNLSVQLLTRDAYE